MNATLTLNILLAAIVVLFVPLGIWRGATAEALVSAGILFGAALADAWAAPLGDDLAGWLGVRVDATQVVVAGLALGAALGLGYAAGATIGRRPSGVGERAAGGILAAINGALLVGHAVRFGDRFLDAGGDNGALDDGIVSGALVHHFGSVLVVAGIAVAACVAVALVLRRGRPESSLPVTALASGPERGDTAGLAASRHRVVRVPRAADAGKFEPPVADGDWNHDRARGGEEMPSPRWPAAPRPVLRSPVERSFSSSPPRPATADPARADHPPPRTPDSEPDVAVGEAVVEQWLRRPDRPPRPTLVPPPSAPRSAAPFGQDSAANRIVELATERRDQRRGGAAPDPGPDPAGAPVTCRRCRSLIRPGEVRCPTCGTER